MRFAETPAVDHHKVDDALWTEMRRHLSEAEITELAAHTMLYIGFGRLNEIVGVVAVGAKGGPESPAPALAAAHDDPARDAAAAIAGRVGAHVIGALVYDKCGSPAIE